MLCHAGPYGEAAGLSQEAEGAREKSMAQTLMMASAEGMGIAGQASSIKFRIG